ncbi:putative gustatory receptor 28b, partial [Musca vetustissima]|uniref:putative gustatory receptor 28b n=1 Tax=Musca vetustissima TaxID=27455 RepID=UPI002AB67B47
VAQESVMKHLRSSNVSKFTDNMRRFNEIRLAHLGLRFWRRNNAFWINLTIVCLSAANVAFFAYGSLVFSLNHVDVIPLAWISFFSPHLIVSSIVILFNAMMQTLALGHEQSLLSHFFETEVSRLTDNLQKYNGMSCVLAILFYCLVRSKYLIHLVEQFEWIELRFSRLSVRFVQKNYAAWINLRIVVMLLANIGFVLYGSLGVFMRNGVSISAMTTISFYSPILVVSCVVVIFSSILEKLITYLKVNNKVLKNLSHQWDTRSIKAITQKQRSLQCLDSFSMYTIVSKNPSEIIQESMEIHQLICEAASTANKYFTYQLLTIISIAFLIIVFDAYYVLETLLGKSKRESKFKTVEFVTFFSCQMILYLIAIISIVEGSNRAIKKSEKTGGIVHALLNKAKTPEVKEKLQQFSMQLLHLKISFTAAGLFNIDRTLYFTISGALTTYLIILLQFTSSGPQSLCDNGNSTAIANLTQH